MSNATVTASAAIDVMRNLAQHHTGAPDDAQVVGFPHANLTVGHCRVLGSMADPEKARLEWRKLIRQLDESHGDAERYAAEQEIIAQARELAKSKA